MNDPELERLRTEALGHESPRDISGILAYNAGDLIKCLVYAEYHPHHSAYRAEAILALSDIVTQARILSVYLDTNLSNLQRVGEERFVRRMEDIKGWKRER